ncbi:Inorganic pyrophosphatase/exopolyphosphatase [Oxalobacteraceae bacterium IMCC9480]|nr:Inorganic pyrophosphatase/exopolyphosphatase [Oxalobacteraceae bacterium IMCC9480]
MKKVEESCRQNIVDLIIANDLTISEFALEKDFIVTDVLRAISTIKNDKFDLVFCGGTCLSKAYGLLERISEDVDIKVVPKPGVLLPNNQRRAAVSKLKQDIVEALERIGFGNGEIDQEALDENTYVVFNAGYSTHFEFEPSMRATVKLELNTTHLSLPSVQFEIGLLFNQLAGIEDSQKLTMQCVNIREALVEKLVSFPRRLAMHLTAPERFKFDTALVRHLFDVHRIIQNMPALNQEQTLKPLLAIAMEKDAKDFARQYPGFLANPVGEINNAMKVATADIAYRNMYDKFVAVMVYGADVPSFDEAIGCFVKVLTATLPPSNVDYLHHMSDPFRSK